MIGTVAFYKPMSHSRCKASRALAIALQTTGLLEDKSRADANKDVISVVFKPVEEEDPEATEGSVKAEGSTKQNLSRAGGMEGVSLVPSAGLATGVGESGLRVTSKR